MKRTTACRLLLAFFTILVSLWVMLGHGPWADDLPYSHLPAGSEDDFFSCSGPRISSVAQLPQAWWHHYIAVNGRLANAIAFLLPLCPAFVIILCQIAFPLLIAALCRLAKGRGWSRSPLTLVSIVILVWLILPWGEQMISADYYLNYVVASALNLWILIIIISRNGTQTKWAFLLAAVAAMMHEGMSLSMDVALICLMLRQRRFNSLSAAYICFSLIPMLSPGIAGHADDVQGLEYAYNFYYYTIGLQLWPLWGILIFTIISSIRHRSIDTLTLIFWIVTAVTFMLSIFARQGGRVFWLPLCLSIAIGVRSIHIRLPQGIYTILCLIGTAIFSVFMTILTIWQYYAAREADSILKELRAGHRVIYRDIIEADRVPLMIAPYLNYVNGATTVRANLSAEAFGDWKQTFAVLPRRFLNTGSLPRIEGTAGAHGNGEVFMARPGLFEVIYTHSLNNETLLTTLRFRGADEVPQKVTLYEVPLSDTLSVYRPLVRAKSLIGTPVIRIDSIAAGEH